MKTRSSLNAVSASPCAERRASARSSSRSTTRIPLPPPPAAALRITGYVIRSAISRTCSYDCTASVVPSAKGTSAVLARARAAVLSPSISIAFGVGPIKTIPASITFCANSSFSDKKP